MRRDGWYRVTQAELSAAGLDANADPSLLQLYADGQQLPMRVNSSVDSFSAGDSIEFYGQALDTPTTDTRNYWLVVGQEPGLRITPPQTAKKLPGGGVKLGSAPNSQSADAATSEAQDAGANTEFSTRPLPRPTVPPSFAYTVELKERLLYFSSLLNGDAENYFGQLISSQPVTESLSVRNPLLKGNKQDASLEVALQGVSTGAHTVHIYFNDVELDELDFNAREHAVKTCVVPAALVRRARVAATNPRKEVFSEPPTHRRC